MENIGQRAVDQSTAAPMGRATPAATRSPACIRSRRGPIRRRLPRLCDRVGPGHDQVLRRWDAYKTVTPASLPAGAPWVFDHPFFLILNVAVGGNWPGAPDATTLFPQQMLVDYVRVSGS